MFRLERLYCTSRGGGFDLLASLKNATSYLQGIKVRNIPCHFFFSISKNYCTKFQATRSSRITLLSQVIVFLPYVQLKRNELFYSLQFTFLESNPNICIDYYIGELFYFHYHKILYVCHTKTYHIRSTLHIPLYTSWASLEQNRQKTTCLWLLFESLRTTVTTNFLVIMDEL